MPFRAVHLLPGDFLSRIPDNSSEVTLPGDHPSCETTAPERIPRPLQPEQTAGIQLLELFHHDVIQLPPGVLP